MDLNLKELSEISSEKREILKQFRYNLVDILTPEHTDPILVKFLKARHFNLEKAELNFREVYWSRLLYELDSILDTFVLPEVFKYRGDTFLGFAKDGTPIHYISAKADLFGFLQSVSTYTLILYYVYFMEYDIKAMKEENERTGKANNEITFVFDLDGYSLRQFTHKAVIETGLDTIRLLQDHYPERWKNVFFVNAPFIFDKIFSIFKPIITDSLIEKIKIVSKDGTAKLLREYIDDNVLPAFLGGKRVDSQGDIYCREFINQGGKVPEKYFLRNCMHSLQETDPGVKVVNIGARSVFNLILTAKQRRIKFRVELRSENGSIDISVLYREFGPDPEHPNFPTTDEFLDPHDKKCNVKMVGTRLRSHCHIAPIDGFFTVINPGIYIVQFDNTSSWFSSRKLFYRVTFLTKNNQTS